MRPRILSLAARKAPASSALALLRSPGSMTGRVSGGAYPSTVIRDTPNAVPFTPLGFVPYSPAGLQALVAWVPALRQVDPRLVAFLIAPPQAMGLSSRAASALARRGHAQARGFLDDLLGAGDPSSDPIESGDPTFDWSDDSGSQGAGGGTQGDLGPGALGGLGDLGGGGDAIPGESDGPGGISGDLERGGIFTPGENPDQQTPGGGGGSQAPAPGTPAAASTQTILDAEARLAAWNRAFSGACSPADYGATPADLTGVADARFSSAVASYQSWANGRGENLPVTGQLDPATYASLKRTTDPLLAGSSPTSSKVPVYALLAAGLVLGGAGIYLAKKHMKKRKG